MEVDDDLYKAPAAVASAAELRLPDAILPKYADFVYQVMLRAVKVRAHLHWLDRANQACLFCPEHETYSHFLVDCGFIQDVWNTLHAVTAPLGRDLADNALGLLLFDAQDGLKHALRLAPASACLDQVRQPSLHNKESPTFYLA